MNLLAADPTRRLPDYENGNFSDIPGLLQSLLGAETPSRFVPADFGFSVGQFDKVVFLFLDAFGWNQYNYFVQRRNAIARKLDNKAVVRKITSQFPSTTAAHVTTLSTGQPVAQHGVYEWQYYEPLVDEVIIPLLFSYAGGGKQRDTLLDAHISASDILPGNTFFEKLQDAGIASYAYIPREFVFSSYNETVSRGAQLTGYQTVAESLVTMKRQIDQASGPSLFYFYTPYIDANAHHYGPFAPQTLAEADATLTLLDKFLFHPLRGRKDVLIVISADHGQIKVDYRNGLYINLQPEFQELRCYLRANRRGQILPPGGSPRDMFLYVQEEYVDRAQTLLRKMLGNRADVFRIEQLIETGLFGPDTPSEAFMSRVGNLVVLPRQDDTIWWYEKGEFELKHNGLHGGLSSDEMEIPLILYSPV